MYTIHFNQNIFGSLFVEKVHAAPNVVEKLERDSKNKDDSGNFNGINKKITIDVDIDL